MAKVLISYRGIPQSHGWSTGDLLADAFEQLGHEVYRYGHYYQKGWKEPLSEINPSNIGDYRFDLSIFLECNDPDPQYLELKYVKADWRVFWEFDTSYHMDFSNAIMEYMQFNHIFYANCQLENFFKKFAPCDWLPYAFCMRKHFCNMKKTIDFSIIGSPWKPREEIRDKLIESGINVQFITGAFREIYIKALAESRVTINYNQDVGRGLLVMRVFEALATKACLITENADGIERVLRPGVECYVYDDTQQLIRLCHELKEDMGLVDWVATNGRAAGMRNTYDYRAKQILHILEGQEHLLI